LATLTFAVAGPGAVAVTGANGSGKSTLLRILAGLWRRGRGRSFLTLEGAVLAPPQRRHDVGYAAPDLAFYEELTVHENLAFAADARGLAGRAGAGRVGLPRRGWPVARQRCGWCASAWSSRRAARTVWRRCRRACVSGCVSPSPCCIVRPSFC